MSLNFPPVIALLGALVLVGAIAGCTGKRGDTIQVDTGSNELMEVCPQVRPQICTMDYTPVCGVTESGHETFSNGCSACSNAGVIGYLAGACDN